MNKKILLKSFNNIKNDLLAMIYFCQSLEWYSLFNNTNIELLSDLFNNAETKIKEIEESSFLKDTLQEILLNEEGFDKEIINEAKILLQRVEYRSSVFMQEGFLKTRTICRQKFLKARKSNNFEIVRPCFEDLLNMKRMSLNKGKEYSEVLKEKIPDLTFLEIDNLFNHVKQYSTDLLIMPEREMFLKSDVNKNKEIFEHLTKIMKIEISGLNVKDYEENFMISFGNKDVRLAINFQEQNLLKFLKCSCHEIGHALYEQGNDSKLNNTFLSGAGSASLHEGIAWFFEKNVGEDKFLIDNIMNKFSISKDLKTESRETSPIRIKADEKNYFLHILIRYEIEKALFEGSLKTTDIKQEWNNKYKDYLGISIKNDNEGILQDPHWFNGQFGYFPSYILGRAYASQLENTLIKNINLTKEISNEDLCQTTKWLSDNVFKFGAAKSSQEILKEATGENFSPKYYLEKVFDK